MFILTKIADLVQIAPHDFAKHSINAIEDNINAKYANKIVQKIGLCVSLYDILWTSEGLIGHGTGLVNVNVEFRMIVFRPFKGETIMARIDRQDPTGMHLKLDNFFVDIFIPMEELPYGSEFMHSEKIWVWVEDGEQYVFDHHHFVRFQVTEEEWHDQTPKGPNQSEEAITTPYKIRGSMAQRGLGICLWYDGEGEEMEEEEQEADPQ